jgi:hypothetical protein
LRVGSFTGNAHHGQSVTLLGITVHTYNFALSPFTILAAFKLTNENDDVGTCDLAVYADTCVDGFEWHPIGALPSGQGFYWGDVSEGEEYIMTVICRSYPLISDVTTYWYGHFGSLPTSIWNQTTVDTVTGLDTGMSFSSQGISVASHDSTVVSVLFRSGNHFVHQPSVDHVIVGDTVPAPVHGSIPCQITLSDAIPTTPLNLFVLVDGDLLGLTLVASNLTSGSYARSIDISPYSLSPGVHTFSFFVVNDVGFISNQNDLHFTVIADRMTTAAQTPTMTKSPMASQTPAPYGSPFPTTYPLVWVWALRPPATFNIKWKNVSEILTAYDSYRSLLRVGNRSVYIVQDQLVNASSVFARAMLVSLSPYSILLAYRITSSASDPVACGLAIFADAVIDNNDFHHVAVLPSDQGFYWDGISRGAEYRISVIGRHYPLVSNISTFWFGDLWDLSSHYWSQTTAMDEEGPDLGIAFSWQNVLIPSSRCICVSVVFRSGDHFVDQPLLGSITNTGLTVVAVSSSLSVQVPIFDPIAGSLLTVLVVADDDLFTLRAVGSNLTSGTYDFTVDLILFSLSLGNHVFSFYVVNDIGFVSEPGDCPFVTIADRTPTATHTPTMTQSPMASQSPAALPSPSPYETCFPLFFLWDSPIDSFFDIYWRGWQDWESSSFGYNTILRVGNDLASPLHGYPVSLSSITLTGVSISLSAFSVLVVFQLTNSDPGPGACDVAVHCDMAIGYNHSHHVAALPGGEGFYWDGTFGTPTLTMNVIGRHYPLTAYLTAFWFGPYHELPSNYWSQATQQSFSGSDTGMAFSWQDIFVPGAGSTSLSVIFRSGNHYVDTPTLTNVLGTAGPGSFSFQFAVADSVPGAVLSIYLVVGQDVAGITLIAQDLAPGTHTIQATGGSGQPLWLYAVNDLGFVSDPGEVFITATREPTSPSATHPATSESVIAATSEATPMAFPEVTPEAQNAGSRGLSTGAIVGIVVPCVLVVGALVVLAIVKIARRLGRPRGFKEMVTSDIGSESL